MPSEQHERITHWGTFWCMCAGYPLSAIKKEYSYQGNGRRYQFDLAVVVNHKIIFALESGNIHHKDLDKLRKEFPIFHLSFAVIGEMEKHMMENPKVEQVMNYLEMVSNLHSPDFQNKLEELDKRINAMKVNDLGVLNMLKRYEYLLDATLNDRVHDERNVRIDLLARVRYRINRIQEGIFYENSENEKFVTASKKAEIMEKIETFLELEQELLDEKLLLRRTKSEFDEKIIKRLSSHLKKNDLRDAYVRIDEAVLRLPVIHDDFGGRFGLYYDDDLQKIIAEKVVNNKKKIVGK